MVVIMVIVFVIIVAIVVTIVVVITTTPTIVTVVMVCQVVKYHRHLLQCRHRRPVLLVFNNLLSMQWLPLVEISINNNNNQHRRLPLNYVLQRQNPSQPAWRLQCLQQHMQQTHRISTILEMFTHRNRYYVL